MTRKRVLIADDQALIRLDVHRLVDAAGFDVCGVASDGREAVELAKKLEPDLVVLDIDMPELDGIEAARRILAVRYVPVVMLTAFGYGEVISRAVEAGVTCFVGKPFQEDDLIEALREASDHAPGSGLASLRRSEAGRR